MNRWDSEAERNLLYSTTGRTKRSNTPTCTKLVRIMTHYILTEGDPEEATGRLRPLTVVRGPKTSLLITTPCPLGRQSEEGNTYKRLGASESQRVRNKSNYIGKGVGDQYLTNDTRSIVDPRFSCVIPDLHGGQILCDRSPVRQRNNRPFRIESIRVPRYPHEVTLWVESDLLSSFRSTTSTVDSSQGFLFSL